MSASDAFCAFYFKWQPKIEWELYKCVPRLCRCALLALCRQKLLQTMKMFPLFKDLQPQQLVDTLSHALGLQEVAPVPRFGWYAWTCFSSPSSGRGRRWTCGPWCWWSISWPALDRKNCSASTILQNGRVSCCTSIEHCWQMPARKIPPCAPHEAPFLSLSTIGYISTRDASTVSRPKKLRSVSRRRLIREGSAIAPIPAVPAIPADTAALVELPCYLPASTALLDS